MLQRLLALTTPMIYRMVPVHAGILVPATVGVALVARRADEPLGLAVPVPPATSAILGLLLLGVSAYVVYLAYTFLVVEGEGSPAEHIRPTRRIVTTGPYAVVRHPTVAGKTLGILGLGLLLRSATFLLLVVPLLILASAVVNRVTQEIPLERRVPGVYAAYRRQVPMLAPRFPVALRLLFRARRVLLSALILGVLSAALSLQGGLSGPAAVLLGLGLGVATARPFLDAWCVAPALPGLGLGLRLSLVAGLEAVERLLDRSPREVAELAGQLTGGRGAPVVAALGFRRRVGTGVLVLVLAAALLAAWATGTPVDFALVAFPVALLARRWRGCWNGLGGQDLALVVLAMGTGADPGRALACSLALHAVLLAGQLGGFLLFLGVLRRGGPALAVPLEPATR